MRLTRKKAIEISISLWTWLAETGRHKREWPQWKKYGRMWSDCALCQYKNDRQTSCHRDCPYYEKFGFCEEGSKPYQLWAVAETDEEHKVHAAAFLKQLEEL